MGEAAPQAAVTTAANEDALADLRWGLGRRLPDRLGRPAQVVG
jgi:hypothetical protein